MRLSVSDTFEHILKNKIVKFRVCIEIIGVDLTQCAYCNKAQVIHVEREWGKSKGKTDVVNPFFLFLFPPEWSYFFLRQKLVVNC